MEIRGYSVSVAKDAGSVNEDSILVDESRRLFIVADGMGGTAAGNIASEAAVQLIANKIDEQSELIAAFNRGESSREEVLSVLENGARCRSIRFEMAQNSPQQRGMGTTISALLLTKTRGFIAHVGHSRIYILRQSEVVQLTEDHSLFAELIRQGRMRPTHANAAKHTDSVTRALGIYAHVQVDTFDFELAAGDSFLLATRGVWGALNDNRELSDVIEAKGYADAPGALISLRDARHRDEDGSAILLRVIAARGEMDAPHSMTCLQTEGFETNPSQAPPYLACGPCNSRKAYPKGTHIQEGQMGEELYVVLDGQVSIEKIGIELASLGSGALFGEMAIMDKAPRSALAVSTNDTRLIEVGRGKLFALMRKEKDIAVKLLWCFVQVLNQRLRSTNLDLMKLREAGQGELTAFGAIEEDD